MEEIINMIPHSNVEFRIESRFMLVVSLVISLLLFPSMASADHKGVPHLYQCAGIGVVGTVPGCEGRTGQATAAYGRVLDLLRQLEVGANPSVIEQLIQVQLGEAFLDYPINSGETAVSAAQRLVGTTVPQQAEAAQVQKEQSCTGIAWLKLTCIGRTISVIIGTILVSITAWLLAISGMLFDFIIDKTILQFGDYFNTYLKTGVEAGWTALRDIANIVIIGMFTFIAISLILGIKEYGERKMIARVLIVAVLINFSLLFTKIIIDASNFTARQFYVAAALTRNAEGTTGINPAQFAQTGIAGQFITYMGVTSIGGTWNALSNQAFGSETNGFATANGWNALVHGVFSGLLLFAAAIVLLYGAFLLLARALLFIFLLITSALAFASYLVPQFAGSGYGWKTWWNSLLRNAVMAPLLVAFLWVSLLVGSQVKAKAGTLGNLITNPQSTLDLDALFSYLIVLGLLFVSIRAASALSHTIAGFGAATIAGAAPFTLGSRLAAPILRQGVGWGGYLYQRSRMGQARTARDEAGRLRMEAGKETDETKASALWAEASKYQSRAELKARRAERGGVIAGSRMNIMDTSVAKAVVGGLGISGLASGASGKGTKSFADQVKARTEAAEKLSAKLAPSADEQRKMEEGMRKQREVGLKLLDAENRKTGVDAGAIRGVMERERGGKESELKGAERELEDAKISGDADAIRSATAKIRDVKDELEKLAEKKLTVTVKREDGSSEDITMSHRDAAAAERKAGDELKKYTAETTEQIGKMREAIGGVAEDIAEQIGRKQGTVLERALGTFTGVSSEVGKKTRDLYRTKRGDARLRRVLAEAVKEESGSGGASSETKEEKK